MDAQTLEYDHFGPWVLEVAASDPPPPIFAPSLLRTEEPILAVKVPRRIERRDARPGMDLYDFLICLYEDDVAIMQREDREVRVRTCRYCDIGHLSVTHTLLHGKIQFGFPGGACAVPFNTAADQPMQRVIGVIRDRCRRRPTMTELPAEADLDAAGLSFYFGHVLADLRHERPSLRLLALQGTVPMGARDAAVARRLFLRASGKRLLESIHGSDGQELMIIDRGQRYAYRWESVYGEVTSYIPLAKVRDVAWQDDVANRVIALTIRTDGGALPCVFTQDNPSVENYRTWLSQLQAADQDHGRTINA